MRNSEHYPDPTASAAIKYHPETEAAAQSRLMKWAAYVPLLRWFHHIPNGGFRNAREAAHLKAMGVKAGVSDLFLPKPRGGFHGLYIEMKSEKGRTTACQNEWISWLDRNGYRAVVCRGAQSAINELESYLKED